MSATVGIGGPEGVEPSKTLVVSHRHRSVISNSIQLPYYRKQAPLRRIQREQSWRSNRKRAYKSTARIHVGFTPTSYDNEIDVSVVIRKFESSDGRSELYFIIIFVQNSGTLICGWVYECDMVTPPYGSESPLKTTRAAIRVIELLCERDGVGVTELANELGLAKSTAHDHLTTLREMGYAVKEGDEYYLSLRFFRLGRYTQTRKRAYELAEQEVKDIAQRTGERAQFIAREGLMGIPLVYASSEKEMPYIGYTIGEPVDLHATATGKVILAHFEEEQIVTVLDQELPKITENTITDVDELREELEQVREQGYAFNREESFEGLQAVAVPIFDSGGEILGGLSVSGPRTRLRGERLEEDIPDLLRGVADEFELKLTYT